MSDRVAFLGTLENIVVTPEQQAAKVIVNSRTGSIVMNQRVTLQNVAVAHGNLTVTVGTDVGVSQPPPLSGGDTVVIEQGKVNIDQAPGSLINIRQGASLADVVNALNAIGATPLDLVSILQAMKAAGALRAELEVI
jgi:flagellar P-ring protein precursor FlgI